MFPLRIYDEDEVAEEDDGLEAPDFFAVGTSPGTPVEPETSMALGSGPTDVSRHMLRAHLSALAARNGLEVLELEEGAGPDSVQAAYEELCQRWHPSRFAVAAEDVRELVAEIAIRIENAYREVSAAEARPVAELDAGADEGSESEQEDVESAARHQEAMRSLARAREAMQRGEIYVAAREFENTLELTPRSREAAAGLQLIGELKRTAHRGSMQRILARGRH